MIQLTEHEKKVFQSLSESTEGGIVAGYLERLAEAITNELIDNQAPTPADIAGAKLMRKLVTTLKRQFQERATISSAPVRVD